MKKSNEFIRKKKRKKAIKKAIIICIFFGTVFTITICNIPILNIKNIEIEGNKLIDKKEVMKKIEYIEGNNLITLNSNKIIKELEENKYIESVNIKKSLLNTIKVEIKEKDITYYIKDDNFQYILDKNLTIIDKVQSVDSSGYAELVGISMSNKEPGNVVSDELLVKRAAENFYTIVKDNTSDKKVTKIDITNPIDIRVYIGNVQIKVGDYDNIKDKMNKAINILSDKEINMVKGYIDVSYDGLPVINKE